MQRLLLRAWEIEGPPASTGVSWNLLCATVHRSLVAVGTLIHSSGEEFAGMARDLGAQERAQQLAGAADAKVAQAARDCLSLLQ